MFLVVGSVEDPHVASVLAHTDSEPLVIDAATLAEMPVTVRDEGLWVDGRPAAVKRGWLRRLAPAGWGDGADPYTAVEQQACLSALAPVVRDDSITWLSPVEVVGAAENKPYQYRRVKRAGVPVPEWLVTTDPAAAPDDDNWVVKPIGPGHLIGTDGRARVVPTTRFDPGTRAALSGAPFLIQRRLKASTHARVITVAARVVSATLPAEGHPLDWRTSPEAHVSFQPISAPSGVHRHALAAARALGAGYTAQDWILDVDGEWWLIDVNPAGQWLFLPPEVSEAVSSAIADFLEDRRVP